MKVRLNNELLLVDILAALLIITITLFPSNVLRLILGLPFVLFFPGYTLIAALYPRREDLDGIERVALSFGLSIAVVPLIGLLLNYTPWGIRLYPIIVSLMAFIVATSAIAWQRRRKLAEDERLTIAFKIALPQWGGTTGLDRALSILLVVAILGAIGTLGYVIATPKIGEKFTEFYILGLGGKAEGYPRELYVGEEGRVILGIVNREYEEGVSYQVRIRIDGIEEGEIGPVVLKHEEKWEEEISFVSHRVGQEQKVEFLLYKGGEEQPYLDPLHLWIDVIERK